MRAAVALVGVIVALAGCGNASADRAPEEMGVYRDDTDGVAVEYPSRWVRSDTPSAAFFTGKVEVLTLASRTPARAEGGCSPLPWATMRDLRPGEFILTVHADVVPPGEDASQRRPPHLVSLPPVEATDLPGGCAVDGIAVRRADFWENSRAFAVILVSRGSLDEEDTQALEETWTSLAFSRVETPSGDAVEGRPYWQVVGTHCGLTGFDFNGKRWVPVAPVEADLTGPVDAGYATLRGEEVVYRSRLSGDEIAFREATAEDPLPPPCD